MPFWPTTSGSRPAAAWQVPEYSSVGRSAEQIARMPCYKVRVDGLIVGGMIVCDMSPGDRELGRMYIGPDSQNRGIGQKALRLMLDVFPKAGMWTLGTPGWTVHNQHFYENTGSVKVRETGVDPTLGWSEVGCEKRCIQGRILV